MKTRNRTMRMPGVPGFSYSRLRSGRKRRVGVEDNSESSISSSTTSALTEITEEGSEGCCRMEESSSSSLSSSSTSSCSCLSAASGDSVPPCSCSEEASSPSSLRRGNNDNNPSSFSSYWKRRSRQADANELRSTSCSSSASPDVRRRGPGRLPHHRQQQQSFHPPWCQLAYWECLTRVGALFPVSSPAVDVFTSEDLPKGSGFDLQRVFQLNEANAAADPKVKSTRTKIGKGILLEREESSGRVWLYNRTDVPVFVSSSTLEHPATTAATDAPPAPDPPDENLGVVLRVEPGFSAGIFDPEVSRRHERARRQRRRGGGGPPRDPYSVSISFGKGWGRGFSRQDVSACPCWLEVCLAEPQQQGTR